MKEQFLMACYSLNVPMRVAKALWPDIEKMIAEAVQKEIDKMRHE